MTSPFTVFRVAVLIFITALILSCRQTPTGKSFNQRYWLDTSRTAHIAFNPSNGWPFDTTYIQTTLTQNELLITDSILADCISDNNNSLYDGHKTKKTIDLRGSNYRRQLIVAKNSKGEKEVWVNCFCRITIENWKTDVPIVKDGGECYFHLKINLTKRMYYKLQFNGYG